MSWLNLSYQREGCNVLVDDWYTQPLDRASLDYLRAQPLLHLHFLLFALQDRIVARLAKYETNAVEVFEAAALHGTVHHLKDDDDEDRWYLPRVWGASYSSLAAIVLLKEQEEIEALIHGRAA